MERKEENKRLISADPERGEYAPVLRVLIAVCYMGVVAAIVAFLAALLSYVSNGMGIDKMAVSSVSFAVFCAVIIGMSIADRKKEREYEAQRKELTDNADRFSGTVTGCEKHKKTIVYANRKYEEVTWRFIVTYKNENGDTETVYSGRYLNDISEVLTDTSVDVLKLPNGEYAFENFSTDGENTVKLEVAEIEDE